MGIEKEGCVPRPERLIEEFGGAGGGVKVDIFLVK